MEKRINLVWKVLFIMVLIGLALIPLNFMQQYVQSLIAEQSSIIDLARQSANYLTDSIQNQSSVIEAMSLKDNYLFTANNLKNGPLTLGLAFLLLLLIDIVRTLRISFVNYFIVAIGLVLFYLIQLVITQYLEVVWAYFISAVFCFLLLAIYLSSAIKHALSGVIFAIGLCVIYSLAFFAVNHIGSLFTYSAMSLVILYVVVVFSTRKVGWNEPAERVKGGAKKLN